MRKSSFTVFILLFCLVFSLQAQTDQIQPPTVQINLNAPIPQDPNVRVGKLANGLTYYIRRNEKPEKRVELRLVVNAGSVLEREDQVGLAHFVEHMAFNGTTNFPHNELVSYLQSIGVGFGADLNANTSFDQTIYILPIPTERKELIDKGLLVLHDWASGITFDQTEIDKERGVILEERRLGLGADQRMRDKFYPVLFQGSQYALRMPIGTKENLETFKRQSIVDFYETWYRPDLMAIVAVGDLNPDEMEAKIKAQFSGIKDKRQETKRPDFPVPDTKGTSVIIATDKEASSTDVQLYYKKAAFQVKTQADLRRRLIKRFYTGMLNARLTEIRQTPDAPFFNAQTGYGVVFRNKALFSLGGSTSPQNITKTIETLLDENRRVQLFGFTQTELDRYKKQYLSILENIYRERNKTQSAAYTGAYIQNFLQHDPITTAEFNYEFGKQVVPTITLADLDAAAKDTTTDDNCTIIVTGTDSAAAKFPTETAILAAVKESETAKLEPYKETVINEPLVGDLPTNAKIVDEKRDDKFGITYWTLSNGVRVVLKPTDFRADGISMYGFSPGGMSLVDRSKAESGLYFKSLLSQTGVKNLSPVQLDKMLAGKQLTVAIGVNELFDEVSASSASTKDFETMMQLVYLKFTDANLDPAIFNSLIEKQKARLPALLANPNYYFYQQVSKVMANNNPRFFDLFDYTNLDRIKLADIKAIYKERFGDASGFTFVFVGNFEPEKIKPLVVKYLGDLPSSNRRETWKDWNIKPPTGPLEKVFRRGVEDKSTVKIDYTGDAPYSRDESLRLGFLAQVLMIKLTEDLREAKSEVYGVGAGATTEKYPTGSYDFTIQFGSAPKNVDDLTKEVTANIAEIQNGDIDEKDISKVKENWLLGLDRIYKDNSFWMKTIINSLKQDDKIYTLEEAKAQISGITKTDLQQAAQKYLKPQNRLQLVLMPETAPAASAAGQMPNAN